MKELRGKKDDSPLVFKDAVFAFAIKGRGVAFVRETNKWPMPEGMWEPWDMAGHTATINGIEMKILGVEAFASGRGPGWPYKHSFCLLVSFEDAKKLGWNE